MGEITRLARTTPPRQSRRWQDRHIASSPCWCWSTCRRRRMGLECDMASADVPREIAGIDGQNLACEPVLFTRKSSNWETANNWRRFSYVRVNLVHVDSHVGVGSYGGFTSAARNRRSQNSKKSSDGRFDSWHLLRKDRIVKRDSMGSIDNHSHRPLADFHCLALSRCYRSHFCRRNAVRHNQPQVAAKHSRCAD